MLEITKQIFKIVDSRTYDFNIFAKDIDPKFEQYFMLKPGYKLQLYVYSLIGGLGAQKSPMCDIDPELNLLLNRVNYFSSSIGKMYYKQENRVLEELMSGIESTLLVSDAYNISRASMKSRIWTITMRPKDDNLYTDIICGHCKIFPMLPYEILGCAAVIFKIAKSLTKHVANISWYFHSLDARAYSIENVVIKEYASVDLIFDVPTPQISRQALEVESQLRNHPDYRPEFSENTTPPSDSLRSFMDNVGNWYKEHPVTK